MPRTNAATHKRLSNRIPSSYYTTVNAVADAQPPSLILRTPTTKCRWGCKVCGIWEIDITSTDLQDRTRSKVGDFFRILRNVIPIARGNLVGPAKGVGTSAGEWDSFWL